MAGKGLGSMNFLGLQEGLTDEELLGSRTRPTDMPPQPPSFTEWQQPPRPPPRSRRSAAPAARRAGGSSDDGTSSSGDEDGHSIPSGVPIPSGRAAAAGQQASVQDWDDDWTSDAKGAKGYSPGYSSPPPPSTLRDIEAGARDPDWIPWDRKKDPNFDQDEDYIPWDKKKMPDYETGAGSTGGGAPAPRDVDGDPLCRHKWDMGTWRDAFNGQKPAPAPNGVPSREPQQQQRQQQEQQERHAPQASASSTPGAAAARVRASMNAPAPSAPSIGTCVPAVGEQGGGVFSPEGGSQSDDDAARREPSPPRKGEGGEGEEKEEKKKKKKKKSSKKGVVFSALPAVPGLEGLEEMSRKDILARFSKRNGWLRKVSDPGKHWQMFKDTPLFCHCEGLMFNEHKDEAQFNADAKPRVALDLTGCCVTSHKAIPQAFELHTSYMFQGRTPRGVHIFLAKDEEDKVNWIRTITLQGVIHQPRLV